MRRLPLFVMAVFVAVIAVAAVNGRASEEPAQVEPDEAILDSEEKEETGTRAAQTESAGRSAQTVHIDPTTGRFLDRAPKAPEGETLVMTTPLGMSSEGLEEVESLEPGGGVVVDLQGRFRIPLLATVTEDGALVIHHVSPVVPDESEE